MGGGTGVLVASRSRHSREVKRSMDSPVIASASAQPSTSAIGARIRDGVVVVVSVESDADFVSAYQIRASAL